MRGRSEGGIGGLACLFRKFKTSLLVDRVRPTRVCAFCGFGTLFVPLGGLMTGTVFDAAVFRCGVALGIVEALAAVTLRGFLGLVWFFYLDGEVQSVFSSNI